MLHRCFTDEQFRLLHCRCCASCGCCCGCCGVRFVLDRDQRQFICVLPTAKLTVELRPEKSDVTATDLSSSLRCLLLSNDTASQPTPSPRQGRQDETTHECEPPGVDNDDAIPHFSSSHTADSSRHDQHADARDRLWAKQGGTESSLSNGSTIIVC